MKFIGSILLLLWLLKVVSAGSLCQYYTSVTHDNSSIGVSECHSGTAECCYEHIAPFEGTVCCPTPRSDHWWIGLIVAVAIFGICILISSAKILALVSSRCMPRRNNAVVNLTSRPPPPASSSSLGPIFTTRVDYTSELPKYQELFIAQASSRAGPEFSKI